MSHSPNYRRGCLQIETASFSFYMIPSTIHNAAIFSPTYQLMAKSKTEEN